MTDYGYDLLFGTILSADADLPDNVLHLAKVSDHLCERVATERRQRTKA